MEPKGIIFDLDNTLADTSLLDEIRTSGNRNSLTPNILKEIKLFPNILNILNLYRSKNIKLGIVTNSPKWYSTKILNHLQILDYFQTIVSYDDVGYQGIKPQPNGINLAIKNLELDRDTQCILYIGDHNNDVVAAYKAGIVPIVPSWSNRDFIQTSPFAVISSKEFLEYSDDIYDFHAIAERCAKKETFDFDKKFLKFIPLNEAGSVVSKPSELFTLCFGRYFPTNNATTLKLHNKHQLSLDIVKKEQPSNYQVPQYWIDLFSHAINKIPEFNSSPIRKVDIVTVIPAKLGRSQRLENMLDGISCKLDDKTIQLIPDLLQFSEGARPTKTLGRYERYEEIDTHLSVNPKYAYQIIGKNIIIIDDVITTGSTLNVAREKLSQLQPARLLGLCIAKTVSLDKELKICPNCGYELVIKKNQQDGTRFYGCTGYRETHNCRYTESI